MISHHVIESKGEYDAALEIFNDVQKVATRITWTKIILTISLQDIVSHHVIRSKGE